VGDSAAVFAAIRSGDAAALEALLGADPALASARDDEGISALLQARYRDRTDMVDAILAAGPELDVFDASSIGDERRLDELLAADAELVRAWSPDGYTPLHLASFFGQGPVARLLIERGAQVAALSRNAMEVMPLHSAVAAGEREVAEILLDHGAPVDAPSHLGFTPLIEAAQNGDVHLVTLLMDRGADPSAATERGDNALATARAKGHQQVIDQLEQAAG
jgi:ankyrin repeat protein